jgi:hypothetical protein
MPKAKILPPAEKLPLAARKSGKIAILFIRATTNIYTTRKADKFSFQSGIILKAKKQTLRPI